PAGDRMIRYLAARPLTSGAAPEGVITHKSCQWIEGEPRGRVFCGAEPMRGRPYCGAHMARAYRVRKPAEIADKSAKPGGPGW
ncbi:MAG: hypothetical protein ACTSXZ_10170, partial [Alphaproteobacteria bacterium]